MQQLDEVREFFFVWAKLLLPKLVPGAHIVIASNPLVSDLVSVALADDDERRRPA
jgi:site-specific DNA-methyltransferase (adenine-specific)